MNKTMVNKKIVYSSFLIIIFVLFLSGCNTLKINDNNNFDDYSLENDALDNVSNTPDETAQHMETNIENTETPLSDCTVGWSCIDFRHRANRLKNCTVTKVETCPVVCDAGRCLSRARSNVTCTPGFKCKGEFLKGYQMEGCDWTSETKCEYGCSNNTCQPKPNITESTSTTGSNNAQPEEPIIPTYIISQGQTIEIDVQGTPAVLKVYNLEDSRVRFMLDSFRSDWLAEGQSHTFPQGLKINVKEIYFQSYQGGRREVRYSLG